MNYPNVTNVGKTAFCGNVFSMFAAAGVHTDTHIHIHININPEPKIFYFDIKTSYPQRFMNGMFDITSNHTIHHVHDMCVIWKLLSFFVQNIFRINMNISIENSISTASLGIFSRSRVVVVVMDATCFQSCILKRDFRDRILTKKIVVHFIFV